MAQKQFAPLLFSGGLDRQYEAHSIETGTLQRIINWQPEPDGSLRTRKAWKQASEDGAPAFPAKTIGALPTLAGYAIPIRRQRGHRARAGDISEISKQWHELTMKNSLLVAIVSWTNEPSATSAITVTPPNGWVSAALVHGDAAQSNISMQMFYRIGPVEREGYETFDFSADVERAQLDISEWRGIEPVDPLDEFKVASGHSTEPDSGISAATDPAFPRQLVIGAIAAKTSGESIKPDLDTYYDQDYYPFTDPVSPPIQSVGKDTHWLNQSVARKTVYQSNPVRIANIFDATDFEDDAKSRWVALVATFKVKERSAADKDWYLVSTENSPTEYGVHAIDIDHLTDGTWTDLGPLEGDAVKQPLAFAHGLGGVLITAQEIVDPTAVHVGMMFWDGTDLIRINKSPRARSVAFHNGRFWAIGTKDNPSRLYFTDVGDPTNWNMEENWIDVGGDGEYGQDLCPVLEGLLVAKHNGLYLVLGDPADSLGVQHLDAGGGMKGRCIVRIPGGAIIASKNHVWEYRGGGVQLISRPLDDWWQAREEEYVSGTYANGLVYLTGGSGGTLVVLDVSRGTWWVDEPNSAPNFIYSRDAREILMATPADFIHYRHDPGTPRERDATPESFEATTHELLLGSPARPATPRHLYVAYSKKNYQAGHPPLFVTPIYDGVEHNPREITEEHPVSGETLENGDFRIRLDIGEKGSSACHKAQFVFAYDAPADNTTIFNIEAAEVMYEVEEPR